MNWHKKIINYRNYKIVCLKTQKMKQKKTVWNIVSDRKLIVKKKITAYFLKLKFIPIFTKVCHLIPPWLSLIKAKNYRRISLQSILITLAHVPHSFPSTLISSSFPTKSFYVFLPPTVLSALPLSSSLLCSFLSHFVKNQEATHYGVSFRLCHSPPTIFKYSPQYSHIEHPHSIFVLHTRIKYAKI